MAWSLDGAWSVSTEALGAQIFVHPAVLDKEEEEPTAQSLSPAD